MADPVACVDCPTCKAERGQKCSSKAGKPKRPHRARQIACDTFVADAYCQNESQSGYFCGRPECPYCAEAEASAVKF